MNILLDTHAWLWMMLEPKKIGAKTRRILGETHSFALSLASVWELAIKHAAGRLDLPEPPLEYVRSRTHADGIRLVPIQMEHACAAASLPRHHGDPFDRMLAAQTKLEKLVLMSHDGVFAKYGIKVLDPVR